ncbi:hypothetical protein CA13_51760 [Planctomycetes bacterium CA13]|uniref:General secretion pathway GspH domain-containing protein n=1 Tax=Novipirellula herctigrandis TaxID=2527986 RepID=A0A5C5Z8M6_9BACT|nr:hypothetical protein CA13_51760 [Planctomycetes bacterium CA13]
MSRVANCNRRGITLIEIMATMSVLLTFGVTAAGILRSVTEIGRQGNQANQARRSAERLADRLRADVSLADEIDVESDGFPLELQSDQMRIRYEVDATHSMLRRSVFTGGDSPSSVDAFLLPKSDARVVEVDSDRVSVRLTDAGVIPAWVIEAAR